uniref:Uncharacterized protein n=1 Tax=Oryza meridionalis TaxID=40149 RepID=A0A0E0C9M0_9ORYZ
MTLCYFLFALTAIAAAGVFLLGGSGRGDGDEDPLDFITDADLPARKKMETMAYGIHRLRFMELNNRCEKQIERDGGEDRNPRWTGDAVGLFSGLDQQGLEVMRFLIFRMCSIFLIAA